MKIILAKPNGSVMVDDEDFEKFSNRSIWLSGYGYPSYRTMDKHRNQKTHYLHKEIMGVDKGIEVDHINGNKLDNRKSNLRLASRGQNVANKAIQKNNTSGFKGVFYNKKNKNWCAQARSKHIGVFKTAKEAAVAYDKKAVELYGEFAKLNFPL